MDNSEIRRIILQHLYEIAKEQGAVAGCQPEEIAGANSIEKGDLDFNVRYLKDNGFVRNITKFVICITHDGIAFFEGHETAKQPSIINQSIKITGGNIGQLNQAHTINNPSQFLSQLADAIEKHPDIDPEKKKSWKDSLIEMANSPVVGAIIRILCSSDR